MATAKQMVDILEKALASNVGIDSVTVDGQTIRFNRSQALTELDYWKRQAAKEAGKRNPFRGVDIGSAF
jgi:hypothetical protein